MKKLMLILSYLNYVVGALYIITADYSAATAFILSAIFIRIDTHLTRES